jgi:hypothetical protein
MIEFPRAALLACCSRFFLPSVIAHDAPNNICSGRERNNAITLELLRSLLQNLVNHRADRPERIVAAYSQRGNVAERVNLSADRFRASVIGRSLR